MLEDFFQKMFESAKNILRKRPEVFLLGFYSFLIIFLINKIPINSDEYLYSSIGNNFADAFRGQACFSCIDTYHTFLLPLLISLLNFFIGVKSIIAYRIIGSLFSIASIFLIYKLFKEIFKESSYLPLLLLLLFPGFFYFGCMAMLDNVAFFFFTLLIYFLVKGESYWEIGLIMFFLFLSKEYYIVFGGFVVMTAILYDMAISNKKKSLFWKTGFFLRSFIASFLFVILALLAILLFPILPYPWLLGTLMLELSGGTYRSVGAIAKEFIYGGQINVPINDAANFFGGLISRNILSVMRGPQVSFIRYFIGTFCDVYVNLYAFLLFSYGIVSYSWGNKKEYNRNLVIIISISVAFLLFWFRTAKSGLSDFRFAFVAIIPIIFFSILAIKDLLKTQQLKVRHYIFISFSTVYIVLWLLEIQKMTSASLLYNSSLGQAFFDFKIVFNVIFYAFPAVIIFSKIRIDLRKIILVLWLMFAFAYKLGPEIVNSYLVSGRSNIEYNLTYATKDLAKIEKNSPNVLTNYSRAYYYYSESAKLPNNIRKSLPIIRPEPKVIYDNRAFNFNDGDWNGVTRDFLCKQNINYIFYVNRSLSDKNSIENIIKNISGTSLMDEFYKKNILNWFIYKFDNRVCSK